MGSGTSTICAHPDPQSDRPRSARSTHNQHHSSPNTQTSFSSFVGNLSGRSFLSSGSNYSTISSTRPWSRVSRRRWNDSTLADPLLASKTAWPVPHIESLFLPEFKINSHIQSEQFKAIDTISQGAFGKVYKVQRIDNGEFFALKVLSKSQVISENAIKQVKDEIHIQEVCGHNPFIVASNTRWQSRKKLYIVTDFIAGGELLTLLENYRKLPERLVQIYVAEIALVLDFLHNAGIIYRDLKPENILLNENGHVQLIDFGLSKWLKYGTRTTTLCGTLQYMAPEVISREPYGHASDWWSLGVITCRMLTDRYPDPAGHPLDGCELSDRAKTLLQRLLEPVPMRRLRTLKSLQETAFFKDFNFTQIRSMKVCPNDILKEHFPDGPPKREVEQSPDFEDFDVKL